MSTAEPSPTTPGTPGTDLDRLAIPDGPTRGALKLIIIQSIVLFIIGGFVVWGEVKDRQDRQDIANTQACLVGWATGTTDTLKQLAAGAKDTRDAAIVLWGPPDGIYLLIKNPPEAGIDKLLDDIKTYTGSLRDGNTTAETYKYPVIAPCLEGDEPPFSPPPPSTNPTPSP